MNLISLKIIVCIGVRVYRLFPSSVAGGYRDSLRKVCGIDFVPSDAYILGCAEKNRPITIVIRIANSFCDTWIRCFQGQAYDHNVDLEFGQPLDSLYF